MSEKEWSERLQFLFEKFIDDQSMTAAELKELQGYIHQKKYDSKIEILLTKAIEESAIHEEYDPSKLDKIFQQVIAAKVVNAENRPIRKIHWYKWSVAAAILLVLFTGNYLYTSKAEKETPLITLWKGHDIFPGANKAFITLEDGTHIELSETQEEIIADEKGVSYSDGSVLFEASKSAAPKAEGTITLHTPAGKMYSLLLPDGSKVWLNTMSKLSYSSKLFNDSREIFLEGEAYFEVEKKTNTKGSSLPFVVRTTQQELTVLGTKFNINSYSEDEIAVTTLVEGSVKVAPKGDPNLSKLLQMNQQSRIVNGRNEITINEVDPSIAIAWQKGIFQFNKNDIYSIMNQLSKWYGIEVQYKGDRIKNVFTGKVHRNLSLSQVLEILRFSKINYELIGNKIIISSEK